MNRLFNCIMIASILFISCQPKNKQVDQAQETRIVGGDKDTHGCIASAGYTWSVVKDSCIRPFEQIQLDIVNHSDSFETAAFLIIDEKKQAAELFLKESPQSIVLKQTKKYEYENQNYKLIQDQHCWTLIKDDKALYKEKQ